MLPLTLATGRLAAAPESVLAVGVAGVLDTKRSAQSRIEHHFQSAWWWDLRPYMAAGVAGDGAYHVGAGLARRWQLGRQSRLMIGTGPAMYRRHDGFDLGNDIEFFSFVQADRQVGREHWIGLRAAHVSNAHLGRRNPGREMLGLVYTRAWRRY